MSIIVKEMIQRGSMDHKVFYMVAITALVQYVLASCLFFRQKNYIFVITGTAWSITLIHAFQSYVGIRTYEAVYISQDGYGVGVGDLVDLSKNLIAILVVMALIHIVIVIVRMLYRRTGE